MEGRKQKSMEGRKRAQMRRKRKWRVVRGEGNNRWKKRVDKRKKGNNLGKKRDKN